jgi:hypothetical protein
MFSWLAISFTVIHEKIQAWPRQDVEQACKQHSGPTTIDTLLKQARRPRRSPKEKLDVARLFCYLNLRISGRGRMVIWALVLSFAFFWWVVDFAGEGNAPNYSLNRVR